MSEALDIIVKPLMTEKVSALTENDNKYGFVVKKKANKYQIKNAIERTYDVKVHKVWTSVVPGKLKRAGKHTSKSNSTKKAYVLVEKGQKIEFFKGV